MGHGAQPGRPPLGQEELDRVPVVDQAERTLDHGDRLGLVVGEVECLEDPPAAVAPLRLGTELGEASVDRAERGVERGGELVELGIARADRAARRIACPVQRHRRSGPVDARDAELGELELGPQVVDGIVEVAGPSAPRRDRSEAGDDDAHEQREAGDRSAARSRRVRVVRAGAQRGRSPGRRVAGRAERLVELDEVVAHCDRVASSGLERAVHQLERTSLLGSCRLDRPGIGAGVRPVGRCRIERGACRADPLAQRVGIADLLTDTAGHDRQRRGPHGVEFRREALLALGRRVQVVRRPGGAPRVPDRAERDRDGHEERERDRQERHRHATRAVRCATPTVRARCSTRSAARPVHAARRDRRPSAASVPGPGG